MPAGSLDPLWKMIALVLGAVGVGGFALAMSRPQPAPPAPPPLMRPVHAVGIRTDTLFVGGYARGSFTQAMHVLASDLSADERSLVGQHLDKIFDGVLQDDGLGRAGRLRVAFERAVRSDGSTRSIRVLAAEAAVAGEMHTAFFYEHEGKPGYFDHFGRTLEEHAWSGPMRIGLRVTSSFGARRMHPILRRILPHAGVDYAAPHGMPVHATADGVVVAAGRRGGYGNLVEVQHPNGYSTRYAHLSRIAVGRSRMVRQGDLIGYVGMTGLATGPHLHYEVRRNGRPVDPVRMAVAVPTPASQLGADPAWPVQRHELGRLLARTPTLLQVGIGPS